MTSPVELLLSLRTTGEYSDLSIRCGQHEFNVHRNIVCLQSSFFASACRPDTLKESGESAIDLKADGDGDEVDKAGLDDPEAVRCMIDFMYIGDYDPSQTLGIESVPCDSVEIDGAVPLEESGHNRADSAGPTNEPSGPDVGSEQTHEADSSVDRRPLRAGKKKKQKSIWERTPPSPPSPPGEEISIFSTRPWEPLTINAKVYELGCKYKIGGLQKVAFDKFEQALETQYNVSDLASCISFVFRNSAEPEQGLPTALLKFMVERMGPLYGHPEIEEAIESIDGLSINLLKMTFSPGRRKIICHRCGTSRAKKCAAQSNWQRCTNLFVTCRCENTDSCESCQPHRQDDTIET